MTKNNGIRLTRLSSSEACKILQKLIYFDITHRVEKIVGHCF